MIRLTAVLALLVAILALPDPALAYVGPGAGLSALGSLLALVGAIALAIVGFVWYPVKRLMRRVAPGRRESGREGERR